MEIQSFHNCDLSNLKKTAQDVRKPEVGEQIRNVSTSVQKVTQMV